MKKSQLIAKDYGYNCLESRLWADVWRFLKQGLEHTCSDERCYDFFNTYCENSRPIAFLGYQWNRSQLSDIFSKIYIVKYDLLVLYRL